jgi:hypothetical protein
VFFWHDKIYIPIRVTGQTDALQMERRKERSESLRSSINVIAAKEAMDEVSCRSGWV